jgi:Bacterial extracellular solute-binding protein, family 7
VVAAETSKGKAALRFKELAEARTAGRVRVDVYPNSRLYKDREELEALQLGAVQMLAPSLSKLAILDDIVGALLKQIDEVRKKNPPRADVRIGRKYREGQLHSKLFDCRLAVAANCQAKTLVSRSVFYACPQIAQSSLELFQEGGRPEKQRFRRGKACELRRKNLQVHRAFGHRIRYVWTRERYRSTYSASAVHRTRWTNSSTTPERVSPPHRK